jgi:hypothetical protein
VGPAEHFVGTQVDGELDGGGVVRGHALELRQAFLSTTRAGGRSHSDGT